MGRRNFLIEGGSGTGKTSGLCGGSRNFAKFIDLFNGVFVLEIDTETLARRLDDRPDDEWGGQGRQAERDLILRLHRTETDIPRGGIAIDATAPLAHVVDEILTLSGAVGHSAR